MGLYLYFLYPLRSHNVALGQRQQDPREPHFYKVKLGFSGVNVIPSFHALLLFLMKFCFKYDLF